MDYGADEFALKHLAIDSFAKGINVAGRTAGAGTAVGKNQSRKELL